MKKRSVMKLPNHAYVPGFNKRHAEDAFDELTASVVAGQDSDSLAQCDAFQAGLYFLSEGFYWEAHELMEPVWMALADDTVERRFVQSLIQLANGSLKLRMGRAKAALRLVGQARSLLPAESVTRVMGLDVEEVCRWIDSLDLEIMLAI